MYFTNNNSDYALNWIHGIRKTFTNYLPLSSLQSEIVFFNIPEFYIYFIPIAFAEYPHISQSPFYIDSKPSNYRNAFAHNFEPHFYSVLALIEMNSEIN